MPYVNPGYHTVRPMWDDIVRAFQAQQKLKNRSKKVEEPPPDPRSNVLRWGKEIDLAEQETNNFEMVVEQRDWSETYREVDVVRVTNPNDESQYVDVERIRHARFSNRTNQILGLTMNPYGSGG